MKSRLSSVLAPLLLVLHKPWASGQPRASKTREPDVPGGGPQVLQQQPCNAFGCSLVVEPALIFSAGLQGLKEKSAGERLLEKD